MKENETKIVTDIHTVHGAVVSYKEIPTEYD